jgi:hypothetical protein
MSEPTDMDQGAVDLRILKILAFVVKLKEA